MMVLSYALAKRSGKDFEMGYDSAGDFYPLLLDAAAA
jgi:hypothetical protein